jgi:hypothetical protein
MPQAYLTAPVSASAPGDTVVVAPPAGFYVAVYEWIATGAGAVWLSWKSGATAVSGPHRLSADGAGVEQDNLDKPHFVTADSQPLVLNLEAPVRVGGHVTYRIEKTGGY